jgi:hypothetical protein
MEPDEAVFLKTSSIQATTRKRGWWLLSFFGPLTRYRRKAALTCYEVDQSSFHPPQAGNAEGGRDTRLPLLAQNALNL